MNNGLSEELKADFPNTVPIERPIIKNTVEPDPNWFAGFTSAEGSFLVRTYKAETRTGEAVKIVFQLWASGYNMFPPPRSSYKLLRVVFFILIQNEKNKGGGGRISIVFFILN